MAIKRNVYLGKWWLSDVVWCLSHGCMNVCVVLENALKWLHGCICFGKEAGARNRAFSFKVASDGGEKCFVCAASAAALVSSSNRFLLGVLQRVVVHVCVLLCAYCICGCRSQSVMAAWLVSRFVVMCVQRCAFATWCCKTHWNGCVKVAWRRGCVRNTIVFCSWELWIVLEWLHQGCDSDLSLDLLNFGAGGFTLKIPCKRCFKIVFFCFGAEIRSWSCNFSRSCA